MAILSRSKPVVKSLDDQEYLFSSTDSESIQEQKVDILRGGKDNRDGEY